MYEYDTPQPVELFVEIASGDITVTASDVTVTTVEVTPVDPTDDRAAQLAARTVVQRDGRRVSVVSPERGGIFRRVSPLRVEVSLPAGSSVGAKLASADLRISGPVRDVVTTSASGDVSADRIDGTCRTRSASGGVRLGHAAGPVRCSVASGDVWIDEADAAVVVKSASGSLHVGASRGDVRVGAASGDVDVERAYAGTIGVRVASGNVDVGVPAGVRTYLDVHSDAGEAASELPVHDAPASDSEPDLRLRLRTHSGDVLVRRATEMPSPTPARS